MEQIAETELAAVRAANATRYTRLRRATLTIAAFAIGSAFALAVFAHRAGQGRLAAS